MKRLLGSKYLLVLVSLLWANPRAWGDTLEFGNGQTMQTEEINPAETIKNFQYGLVRVNYTSAAVKSLKINGDESYKILPGDLFVSDAHASASSLDKNIFTAGRFAHEALRSAMRFEDVRPFITQQAYENLVSKRNDGSKELLILQILRTTIPDQIEIVQTQIKDDTAQAVARGKINGQDFWGTLTLERQDGKWKLAQETWYGNESKPVFVKNIRTADDFLNQINDQPDKNFVKWVDSAGRPKSTLPLEYGKIRTPKNSFCFFFFLNPQKHEKKDASDTIPLVSAIPSPDMHIVWPSGLRHDPKVYEGNNSDGFDVSVAADKDGYYPNKMNLRLPSGKPREVYVGFLMAF
jgi:hypothetical protein